MIRMMTRFLGAPLAILFSLFLAIAPLTAADRIPIPASPCGPAQALKTAGHSHLLVPQLQHENGNPLVASEVRTATDTQFFLPKDAEPDRGAYIEFISAETKAFGPSKGCSSMSATKRGPPCADQLKTALATAAAEKTRADKAITDLKAAEARAKKAVDDLKKEQDKNHFPWWTLLFLLAAVPAFLLGRRRTGDSEEETPRHGTLGPLTPDNPDQPDNLNPAEPVVPAPGEPEVQELIAPTPGTTGNSDIDEIARAAMARVEAEEHKVPAVHAAEEPAPASADAAAQGKPKGEPEPVLSL